MSRPPSKIVFVGNIPYGLSEEQISDIFGRAGRVVSFRLVYDRENGKPKGFGFAEYPDADSAASAVRNLNDFEVMGRKLRVDFSNENNSMDDDHGRSYDIGGSGGGSNNNSNHISTGLGGGSDVALPPLPPGKEIPPGATATDEISRVLRTLPPTQLLDVLAQMKTLATNDPARATELLTQAPQLAYAVFQALLLMDLVSPEAIQSVVEVGGGGLPLNYGAAAYGVAPTAAPMAAAPVVAAAAPVAAVAPEPVAVQNTDELIKQVLELPQSMIDQLPEAERTQLMALRMQYGGGRP